MLEFSCHRIRLLSSRFFKKPIQATKKYVTSKARFVLVACLTFSYFLMVKISLESFSGQILEEDCSLSIPY